jgi:hypothetical protein
MMHGLSRGHHTTPLVLEANASVGVADLTLTPKAVFLILVTGASHARDSEVCVC